MKKIKEMSEKNKMVVYFGVLPVLSIILVSLFIWVATPKYVQYSMEDSYGHKLPVMKIRSMPLSSYVTVVSSVGESGNVTYDIKKSELEEKINQADEQYHNLGLDANITSEEVSK